MIELINTARTGDSKLSSIHLAEAEDINHIEEEGYTPLIIATYNNELKATATLLHGGADLNARDNGGNTALVGECLKDKLI